MKRRNIFIIIILVSMLVGSLYLFHNKKNVNKFDDDCKVSEKEKLLSYMIETSSGTGEYENGTSTKYQRPSDGYVFNTTLSKCQNGSELSWNSDSNSVVMIVNVSDKCYVYFDKLLSFVIAETSYYAEAGMTWESWINSSYSIGRI